MTKNFGFLVLIILSVFPAALAAQVRVQTDSWTGSQLLVTRAELEQALENYRTLMVEGRGRRERHRASTAVEVIERRLTEGDFRPGDWIFVYVRGLEDLPDSVVVDPGLSVLLPGMEPISLTGVLRSELVEHLTNEIGRYVRDPMVRASSTIRLTLQGGVGQPGYYSFPAQMPISEAVMAAGGPGQSADMDKITVRRGSETFLDRDEYQEAITQGQSLDQLGLRAGDEIVVPVSTGSWWPQIIRWGVMIASVTLIGIRIY